MLKEKCIPNMTGPLVDVDMCIEQLGLKWWLLKLIPLKRLQITTTLTEGLLILNGAISFPKYSFHTNIFTKFINHEFQLFPNLELGSGSTL